MYNIRALLKRPYYSALAQLVEQMTVNHWVAGSSPAGGANFYCKTNDLQNLTPACFLDTIQYP